jgi:hypothetical protein
MNTRTKRKLSEFEQAFADARKEGLNEFTFKGKRYSTRRKDDPPDVQYVGDKKPVLGENKPQRPEYKLTDVDRPGTRVRYENEDADMPTFRKGGKVGSASKRADGIAMRGKTRGRMI